MEVDDVYQYSELTGKDAIRLIYLQPCDDLEAGIECSLKNTTLVECRDDIGDHYIAISYVWGDPDDVRSISIDRKRLYITASLESALRHFRDGRRVLRVWADGVCINQKDIHDRNRQVRLMGDIYSIAQHTIIFLGQSSPQCDAVLKMINSEALKGGISDIPAELLPAGQFERVIEEEILARPWFTRVWILQELFLSQDPWLQCGKSRVRWNVFCKQVMASNSSSWTSKSRLILKNMRNNRSKFRVTNESIPDRPEEPGLYLFELLSMRRACGLSDPRDMIYAHLGLAGATVVNAIAIDYDKTVGQVYEDITLLLLKWTTVDKVLSFVEKVQPENRRFSRPSWVPDWSDPHWSDPPWVDPNRDPPHWSVSGGYYGAFKTSKYGNGAYSLAVPHLLALNGIDLGLIDTIFPKSFWPEVDFYSPNQIEFTSIPNFVDWLSRTDDDFPRIRRLLVNFSAGAIERSCRVFPEGFCFGGSSKLIDIISNWAEMSAGDDLLYSRYTQNPDGGWWVGIELDRGQTKILEEKRKQFAHAVLQNLLSWIYCYTRSKNVAVLSTGVLVRVSDLARVGDAIISDASWECEKHYIMRSCETPITQEQEKRIRADLEMQVRENSRYYSADKSGKYTSSWPIQTCRFVTSAFRIWGGIFGRPTHNRLFDEERKIFAVR
jgi:hypothetical protein